MSMSRTLAAQSAGKTFNYLERPGLGSEIALRPSRNSGVLLLLDKVFLHEHVEIISEFASLRNE